MVTIISFNKKKSLTILGTVFFIWSQIAKFMGPTWGPLGSCRPQMGPILAPWILLSGVLYSYTLYTYHLIRMFGDLHTPILCVLLVYCRSVREQHDQAVGQVQPGEVLPGRDSCRLDVPVGCFHLPLAGRMAHLRGLPHLPQDAGGPYLCDLPCTAPHPLHCLLLQPGL